MRQGDIYLTENNGGTKRLLVAAPRLKYRRLTGVTDEHFLIKLKDYGRYLRAPNSTKIGRYSLTDKHTRIPRDYWRQENETP